MMRVANEAQKAEHALGMCEEAGSIPVIGLDAGVVQWKNFCFVSRVWGFDSSHRLSANVAQMAMHLSRKQDIVGSSPAVSSVNQALIKYFE
jgi:hypothetical protein